MVTLQNDLLEIYNALVSFSKNTVQVSNPVPIKVWYDKEGVGSPLVFEQKGTQVRLRLPVYYCLALEEISKKPSWLLPEDYDYLMNTLSDLIMDQRILEERTCLSPENFGFDIYATDPKEFSKGPDLMGTVRFISGTGWLFKLKIKLWKFR